MDDNTSTTKFSKEVDQIISEILPSNDPIDQQDFDAIEYINNRFPTEQSLGTKRNNLEHINLLYKNNNDQIKIISEQISSSIRESSTSQNKISDCVDESKQAISELFDRVKSIQDKAQQSETMVQEICSDIRNLDTAKKNLTSTITSLKRLQMLISACDKLESLTKQHQYDQCCGLIDAIDILFEFFKTYNNISIINNLRSRVNNIKARLKSDIFSIFRTYYNQNENSENISSNYSISLLNSATRCIDSLGDVIRQEFINTIMFSLLESYKSIFNTSLESSSLDNVERRFAWLWRSLKSFDNKFENVFPPSWNIHSSICNEFCEITSNDLKNILKDTNFDVTVLVRVLTHSINFEEELNEKYGFDSNEDNDKKFDTSTAEGIKQKYTHYKKQSDENFINKTTSINFIGKISSVFAPHMHLYVTLEEKKLSEVIDTFDKEEKWISSTESSRYKSSDEFFLYIKNSLKRCSKLNKGKILFDIYKVFQNGLHIYCELLNKNINVIKKDTNTSVNSLCYFVNTCEYCVERIQQLEENIKNIINQEFKNQIDLEDSIEEYQVSITNFITTLVSIFIQKTTKAFNSMIKLNWSNMIEVGDSSQYVLIISDIFNFNITIIRKLLISIEKFNFFCNNLILKFYTSYIYKCKKIGEFGGQQLLFDAYSIKTILEGVYNIGEIKSPAPKIYLRIVKKEMNKVEGLLKTIVSTDDRLLTTCRTLLTKINTNDLKKILDLRGMPRKEQNSILEQFNSSNE